MKAGAAYARRIPLGVKLGYSAFVAVLVPVYSHLHHPTSAPGVVVKTSQAGPADTRANVDDTVLMNQIDSELSEDVPDALRPLADLGNQTTKASSVSEKKNVTQE